MQQLVQLWTHLEPCFAERLTAQRIGLVQKALQQSPDCLLQALVLVLAAPCIVKPEVSSLL